MAFEAMKADLIKKGLLDQNSNLTQKGHEYVKSLSKELTQKTIENGEKYDYRERKATERESEGLFD